MAWAITAAAAPAVLSGGFKAITGMGQARRGRKLAASNHHPTYMRPVESTQALNLAEQNYRNGMPGEQLYLNDIQSSQAAALESATQGASGSGDIIDAATKINANAGNSYNDFVKTRAGYKAGALQNYIGQLGNQAHYSDKEFQYNQDEPYKEKAATASALIGAGNQNIYSGIDDITGAAASAIGSMNMDPSRVSSMPNVQGITGTDINPTLSGNMVFDLNNPNRWRRKL